MAFHVACPLTCQKICTCSLGGAGSVRKFGSKEAFEQSALALQRLLTKSPLMVTTGEDTVEVLAPRLSKEHKKRKKKPTAASVDEEMVLPREAPAAEAQVSDTAAAPEEDTVEPKAATPETEPAESVPEEMAQPPAAVKSQPEGATAPGEEIAASCTCTLCLQNEQVGSSRYDRMLVCEGCQGRFHRKCLKPWAEHRDLFNWASWRCHKCRTCEDCKATGDPNRLLFCKRCDEAHHANCKQTGAKTPARGPFLCPKHAQCHSCATRLPGGGSSSRWFHSYLFCDACGRLFVKNKYCPICLKVYRESEAIPMICCDICEHWVHVLCEGISDEKYQEFQKDANLRFTCGACRGDDFQSKSIDEAIVELWRRKDEADRDQIAKQRAAAGLPSEEEMAKLCPSSDDEAKPAPAKEAPAKGRFVIKIKKGKTDAEAETKQPLKLKIRSRPPEADSAGEASKGEVATRGQRSKRKRPAPAEETTGDEPPESDEDDTSILQRLGVDAVAKRVEVRQPDHSWLRGTIANVNQRRSQITVNYDKSGQKTLKYGKEKVRLLGKK